MFSSISKWVTGSNHHARHEPIIWKANNRESDRLEKLDSISDQGLNRSGVWLSCNQKKERRLNWKKKEEKEWSVWS